MEAGTRFAKTPKGVDEMNARGSALRGKLRMMLILTDPSKPAESLLDTAARIGAAPDWLDLLQRDGYIAPVQGHGRTPVMSTSAAVPGIAVEVARFEPARQFMRGTLQVALGARADDLQRRIDACDSLEALANLAPAYEKAIADTSGPYEAEALAARLRQLLG